MDAHADARIAVAVVIVNYNAGPALADALRSLVDDPAIRWDALVVDNASRDGSIEGVEGIASAAGFGTSETMRRTFLRLLRTSPSEYRRRFRAA